MNKYVIYTVMAGNYGEIYQPIVIDRRFDYILFSNDIHENVGIWKVRPIPEVIKSDNKRLSRYPKTHPVSLLHEYDASLYIDANIQIVDDWVYERFLELVETNIDIAGIQLVLTGRDCIYSHSYDMCTIGAEHDYNAIVQMHALRKAGFPEHWGLNENNLIWRRHNDVVEKIDDEWWNWIINYSYRDQFSYMYCLWANKIHRSFFLPIGEDTTNSVHFNRIQHNSNPTVASKKFVSSGFFEKWRNRCRTLSKYKYERYRKQWVSLSKLPFPKFSLFVWGGLLIIINSPLFIKKKLSTKIQKSTFRN